jgi:hypothetical protein
MAHFVANRCQTRVTTVDPTSMGGSIPVSPSVPAYSNGVIKLNKLKRTTVLGYMFGGIFSTVQQTGNTITQTGASNQAFQVTLTPNA